MIFYFPILSKKCSGPIVKIYQKNEILLAGQMYCKYQEFFSINIFISQTYQNIFKEYVSYVWDDY